MRIMISTDVVSLGVVRVVVDVPSTQLKCWRSLLLHWSWPLQATVNLDSAIDRLQYTVVSDLLISSKLWQKYSISPCHIHEGHLIILGAEES